MNETIATVNGAPILANDLRTTMRSLAVEQYRCSLEEVPTAALAGLRAAALERLVARELIFQAALAEGVVAGAAEVAAEQARILRLMGNPADLSARLAAGGLDESALQRMVRKDVTVDLMTARRLDDVPEPAEAEIQAFYRAHPEMLRSRERVRASHILIEADPENPRAAEARAEALREAARDADFAELARCHSACPSAPGGGDLGFIRREDVDPTFADAAFSQPVGEVGPPVRTPYGTHLILVTEREPAVPLTLDEARPRIVHVLRKAEGSRRLAAWVAELRQAAKVEVLSAEC